MEENGNRILIRGGTLVTPDGCFRAMSPSKTKPSSPWGRACE